MARSTWVAHAFDWEKLFKCHLKGKASKKLAKGQNIDYSEKRNGPRASSAPALWLNTLIFKHVYWYIQQTHVSVYRTIGPLVAYSAQTKEIMVHYILQSHHIFICVKVFILMLCSGRTLFTHYKHVFCMMPGNKH